MASTSGLIISLQTCPGHALAMRPVNPARFGADQGLDECRHARAGSRRQVLLIEGEVLEDLRLRPGMVKENVTTRDIELQSLAENSRLFLGDEVELWITGPCHPCEFMNEIRPGLEDELRGRRGVLAWVKTGGEVRVGDRIEARPPNPGSGELR